METTKTNGNDRMFRQTPGLNPFLPFSLYIPDGEPKVFGERVYLYGSFDRFAEGYCCGEYHVVSAPVEDLTDWTDHGVSFSAEDVPWSDALLYAPDALYHNGKYYLFFCMSDGSEGVAESDAPEGPFRGARRITLGGTPIMGIDPSVLEDGGHIYYTWGQFHLNVGELDDDLCTLKPETVRTDVLSNGDGREGFHEGSSLRKLGDLYCMIYASEYADAYPHHGARPTKLDYAVSRSPYGPYTRRGTVIDNEGCDPQSWNDHGSVIRIGERWYVFYHASTNNSQFSRRARVERLAVDEERGHITQAIPTTNGFLDVLLPEHVTSPVHACRFFGGAYVTETADGCFSAILPQSGAGFAFSPVQFGAGTYTLALRYRATGMRLRAYLGEAQVLDAPLPDRGEWGEAAFPFTADGALMPLRIECLGSSDVCRCEIGSIRLETLHNADPL